MGTRSHWELKVACVLTSPPPSVHHSHPPGPRAKIAQRFLGVAEVGAVDIFSLSLSLPVCSLF